MSTDLYKVSPGDLITAKLFNGLQDKITQDTAGQIKKAIDEIKGVPQAGDAQKLGGKTPDELEKKIIDRALAEIQKRSGYKMIFKRLELNKFKVVNHDLKAFPLVDAYQLDYFEVVCADGEDKENKFVNFYLYHSDEGEQKRVGVAKEKITIEASDDRDYVFKMRFDRILDFLGIKYTPSQSIADVVTEFWEKLFERPLNDQFDPDQYCNSPWFEKCCGDNRAMSTLQGRDNVDQLYLKMMPRKTINFPAPLTSAAETPALYPNNLEVVHLDFEHIGIKLLRPPHFDPKLLEADAKNNITLNKDELKIMLLLKV